MLSQSRDNSPTRGGEEYEAIMLTIQELRWIIKDTDQLEAIVERVENSKQSGDSQYLEVLGGALHQLHSLLEYDEDVCKALQKKGINRKEVASKLFEIYPRVRRIVLESNNK